MLKTFFAVAAVIFFTDLQAYPITPRPLRKLVIESEYIIRGRVLELGSSRDTKKDRQDPWDKDYAIIEISEQLQGNLPAKKIKVYFTSGMVCPSPGVFYANEEVLTFLDKMEKGDGYYVHALSYGVKHGLTEEGFDLYKTRIKEMQAILQVKNVQEQEEKILDWLVTCSEHKPTRWEGTYELSPGSDFMSFYDRDDRVRKDIFLTSRHREKLFSALLKQETLDYVDLGLTDIAMGIDDDALLGLLKKSMLQADTVYIWSAAYIMERIVTLTADNGLETIYKEFSKLSSYEDKDAGERKRLLALFISEMQTVERKKTVVAAGRNVG